MFTQEVIINIYHEKFYFEITSIDLTCDRYWLVKLEEVYSEEQMGNTSFMYLQDSWKIPLSLLKSVKLRQK